MATYIIHLSDLHIKDNEKINYAKCRKIIDLINLKKDDNACIVISGDIADTGKENQYQIFKKMETKLIKLLKDKLEGYYPIYVVPGNHDLFAPNPRNRVPSKKQSEKEFEIEIKNFKNFYSCFENLYGKDKYYSKKSFKLKNNSIINFHMINSSAFSSVNDENNDTDIGTHNLPKYVVDELVNIDEEEFNILISHYPLNYFSEEQRYTLENILCEKFKLCLFGHEHTQKYLTNNTLNNSVVYVSGAQYEEGFNLIKISDKNVKAIITNYSYNNFNGDYYFDSGQSREFDLVKKNIELTNEFIDSFLLYDEYTTKKIDLEKIVFIGVNKVNEGKKQKINEFDELIEEINNKTYVLFEGENLSGKTTLAKKIFYELYKRGNIGVYLDCKKYNKIDIINDINKEIIETYKDGKKIIGILNQMEKEKKFLIIDNVDLIKDVKKKDLWLMLNQNYGKVMFFYSDKNIFAFDDELKIYIEKKNEECSEFTLCKCNHKVRVQLIEKKYIEKKIKYDKHNIEKTSHKLANMSNMIDFNPYYINLFSELLVNGIDNENILLGSMIESNINQRISCYCDPLFLEPFKEIICNIAYFSYVNKRIFMSEEELIEIVKKYKGIKATFIPFEKMLIDSKIMLKNENGYYFAKDIELSFFLSKWILMSSDVSSNNYNKSNELIDYMLSNIIHGINSTVLLLLAFYTYNVSLLEKIIVTAECEFENIRQEFLSSTFFKNKEVLLNYDNINFDTFEEKNEDSQITYNTYKVTNIYEIKEYSAKESLVLRGKKYLEILAKIIYNYSYRLGDLNNRVVKNLFELPNKLICLFFEIFESKLEDQMIELIKQIKRTNSFDILQTKELVKELVTMIAIGFINNTYQSIAVNAINKLTIRYFSEYNGTIIDNWVTKLQKQYFYVENEDFEKVYFIAENIIDDCNNPYILFFSKLNLFRLQATYFKGNMKIIERIEKIYPKISKKELMKN